MSLTGKASKAGVMGWPIGHSLSPALHGWWLARHGIDGVYVPMAVQPENLAAALRALPILGFAGCNLTIPHKEPALTLVARRDEVASRIGAGGAARAVIVALLDEGVPEIRLTNRTDERSATLAAEFGHLVKPTEWERRHDTLGEAVLLVNTTSQGMSGEPALELALDRLPQQALV